MSRKLIYRGKIKDSNDWFHGDLIRELSTGRTFICDISHLDENTKISDVAIEVDSKTVCQYTGLKDKNEKKIFEHDLIKCSWLPIYSSLEIVFKDGSFYLKSNDGNDRRHIPYSEVIERIKGNFDDIEIVGNIYDNPELVKEEE